MCSSESDGTGDRRQQETVGRRRDKAKRQRKQTKQNVAQVPLHFSFHFSLFFCGSQTLGRALTHQHTHTDARTVGQWKQCINMISRTTAEPSRAESRELMPFPGHGLRLELELGHGKVIGRCPDRLLAGHMAPPTPTPPPPPPTAAAATAPAQHKLLVQPTCMCQIQDTIQEILAYFGSC